MSQPDLREPADRGHDQAPGQTVTVHVNEKPVKLVGHVQTGLQVKQAAIEAVNKYGLGASGSPILSGTFDIHEELAREVASFKGKDAAILFPTGYSANVGFISSIMRSGDTIFCDQYSHASIVDGAILAKSKTVFFRHNNPLDLERRPGG